jgi:hypothetical protein
MRRIRSAWSCFLSSKRMYSSSTINPIGGHGSSSNSCPTIVKMMANSCTERQSHTAIKCSHAVATVKLLYRAASAGRKVTSLLAAFLALLVDILRQIAFPAILAALNEALIFATAHSRSPSLSILIQRILYKRTKWGFGPVEQVLDTPAVWGHNLS